ncbi:MAG: hypothetical protein R3C19_02030 [Planctomycetaceae bacterium]
MELSFGYTPTTGFFGTDRFTHRHAQTVKQVHRGHRCWRRVLVCQSGLRTRPVAMGSLAEAPFQSLAPLNDPPATSGFAVAT